MRRLTALFVTLSMLVCLCTPAFATSNEDNDVVLIDSTADMLLTDEEFELVTSRKPGGEYYQMVYNGVIYIMCGDGVVCWVTRDPHGGFSMGPVGGKQRIDWEPTRLSDCILNVPIKSQGESNCWAAACAMIISYKTTNDPTAEDVCKKIYFLQGDHSGDIYGVQEALQKYGLHSAISQDVLSFQDVKYQLEHSCPIFLDCKQVAAGTDSDKEHAVVLVGFREEGDYVRLYFNDSATQSRVDKVVHKSYTVDDTYITLIPGELYVHWYRTAYNIYRN